MSARQEDAQMYRTIVVALDGSELAERALPYAEMLARAAGGRLVLVRAAAPSRTPAAALQDLSASVSRVVGPALTPQAAGERRGEPQAREVEAAEAALRQLATRLGQQGLAVETAVPVGSTAADAILGQVYA